MAKARSANGKPATTKEASSGRHPEGAKLSLRMAAPSPPRESGGGIAQGPPAGTSSGMFVLDISEDLEITGKFICKVPMANDVLYCTCGGVMSQRFNESLFCRTCGREGSH